MTTITTDMLGKIITFDVFPAAILGSTYSRVKLLGILDPATAINLADIPTMHANVFPTIPAPSRPEDNYASYNYLKLGRANGQVDIVGIPWIDGEITINENQQLNITVTDISGADYDKVKRVLIAAGYPNLIMTLTSP